MTKKPPNTITNCDRTHEKIEFAPAEAIRYNERTVAERSNARLKDEFGANNVRVTGRTSVQSAPTIRFIVEPS